MPVTPEERKEEYDRWLRFRPYRATGRGALQNHIAAAGCETLDGIGLMLVTLQADGEFTERDRVGILDTGPWEDGLPAAWLINPHASGTA